MTRNKIPVSNTVKYWVFRYYLWVTLLLFVAAMLSITTVPWKEEWKADATVRLTILGIPFAFLFFVQKQKIVEATLLKELFKEFSARYEELKKNLRRIGTEEPNILNPDNWNVLESYFNLCAEEYLFVTSGHIPPEVWRSWEIGMNYHFRNPRIKAAWDKDAGDDSDDGNGFYYGFEPPV